MLEQDGPCSRSGPMAGFCKGGNEPLGSLKANYFVNFITVLGFKYKYINNFKNTFTSPL